MSAGSGASNLGYGKFFPLSNMSSTNANLYNIHDSSSFGSKVIPGTSPNNLGSLSGTKDNVAAAASKWPGPTIFKGGAKRIRRKIKNITKKYKKMSSKSKKRVLKNAIKKRYLSRSASRSASASASASLAGGDKMKKMLTRRIQNKYASRSASRSLAASASLAGGPRRNRSKRQRGGYAQFQNNMPLTNAYSTGGELSPSMSALANPVPFKVIAGGNCVDNYNHFAGKGFSSAGH
jgi:hypothetical protein